MTHFLTETIDYFNLDKGEFPESEIESVARVIQDGYPLWCFFNGDKMNWDFIVNDTDMLMKLEKMYQDWKIKQNTEL